MSVWGKRESYGMVTWTVVFWVCLSALAHIFRPLIPADLNETAAASESAYMRAARRQPLEWRPMSDAVFAESARTDKPILVMIGTGFSSLGERMDGLILMEDVAASISLNYIPVRIDVERETGWKGRLIQGIRAERGDTPWFQLYLMNFKGEIVLAPSHVELWRRSGNPFYLYREEFGLAQARGEPTAIELTRRDNEFQLTGGRESGIPNVDGYLDRLVGLGDAVNGGFNSSARKLLNPQDFWLLYEAGMPRELIAFLRPVLLSPAVDVMDGGFFLSAETASWDSVEYTKVSTVEAAMMELMAEFSGSDPLSMWLATRTFDRLMPLVWSGQLPSAIRSKKDDMERSLHFSFSPRRLRREGPNALTPRELEWTKEVLGLDVRRNPQMSVRILKPNRFVEEPEMRDRVMAKLRLLQDEGELETSGEDLLYVRAYTLARLISASRILGSERRAEAIAAFQFLREDMRLGLNDVYREVSEKDSKMGNLVDYLAYADAALQAYRVTGDDRFREDGESVLQRGLYLFEGEGGGLTGGRLSEGLSVILPLVPEVVDSEVPSSLGWAVMLLADYGDLRGGAEGRAMLEQARRYLSLGGGGLGAATHGYSGLARASLRLEQAWRGAESQGGLESGAGNRP